MKTEHTPEPWSYGEDKDGWYVEKDGLQIAHGLSEEDARRIVACVNACAGLPTEFVEQFDVAGAFQAVHDLEQQRDELLAAIDTVVKAIMIFRNEPTLQRLHALRSSNGYGVLQQAMDIGLDVIASVEGKA